MNIYVIQAKVDRPEFGIRNISFEIRFPQTSTEQAKVLAGFIVRGIEIYSVEEKEAPHEPA